jgi:hypothetical protein
MRKQKQKMSLAEKTMIALMIISIALQLIKK